MYRHLMMHGSKHSEPYREMLLFENNRATLLHFLLEDRTATQNPHRGRRRALKALALGSQGLCMLRAKSLWSWLPERRNLSQDSSGDCTFAGRAFDCEAQTTAPLDTGLSAGIIGRKPQDLTLRILSQVRRLQLLRRGARKGFHSAAAKGAGTQLSSG